MRSIAAVLLLFVAAAACGGSKPEPLRALSKAQWHSDLAAFARELPKRHVNAFHHVTREQFAAAVADLDTRVDTMNDDAIVVGLMQLAAQIGDAHTYVTLPSNWRRFPIGMYPYDGVWRVNRVTAGNEALLGGKIISIDDTPIATVTAKLQSIVAQDESDELIRGMLPAWISSAEVLHGLGVTKSADRATIVVAKNDGSEARAEVIATSAAPAWIYPSTTVPLYRSKPESRFFFEHLAPQKTVYVAWRGYEDLRNQSRELFKLVDANKVEKLVFDLRQNGGGDYTDGRKYIIDELKKRPALQLFLITGRRTFSAAMNNAIDFRKTLHATLVGEPIGERPNSFQEGDQFTLPASKLVVSYSTKWYEFLPGEGAKLVTPDKAIESSWAEYAAGKDAPLEWILATESRSKSAPPAAGDRSPR